MSEDEERRNHSPSIKNKDECRRGPRSLVLKRAEGGFGFTLRHFIVYPPESYTLLGGSSRDGPMDTIFVKWVRPASPAALAGLATGDRVLRVNGESIAGRPYSHVVRLIQQSPSLLHLLVAPQEEDLIQKYFSETAHNPETNQRPLREMPIRSSSQQRTPCQMGSENDGCRLTVESTSRRGSQDTHSSDDSLILNRIKKSLEQKEEFLRSPVGNREYYNMRPGKLPTPHWPPAIPASSVQPRGSVVPNVNSPTGSPEQRNSVSPTSSNSFIYGGPVTNVPGVDERLTARRLVRDQLSPPNTHQLRMVSERARQFETGLLRSDRVDLYRSELARLGTKRNVPNVAVRRKEFESRSDLKKTRESRSLDNNTTSPNHQRSLSPPTISSSGNRTIPIGSTKIHCDPPKDYKDYHQPYPERKPLERPIERPRSNSAEGVWSDKEQHFRHKAVRQDSYLAAVKKPFNDDRSPEITVTAATPKKSPKRPDTLFLSNTNRPATAAERDSRLTPESRSLDSSPSLDPVHRRNKSHPNEDQGSEEDEKTTRRMSYLKATWGGRCNIDSDADLSDVEPPLPSPHKSVLDIPPKEPEIEIEGILYCKVILVEGKKAHDRSWRQVWGVVRKPMLYLFKDKKDSTSETPVDHERIELSTNSASAADDYTKRRHVIRLSTPNISEILLQAESQHDMAKWLSAMGGIPHETPSPGTGQNVSPVTAHKGIMKLTNTFRNRSPTGQSPVNKTRKPSQSELIVVQPKSKTWKGMVAKQLLKRIQAGSPVSPTAPPSYPEGATIGVPLELCPPSANNLYVPLLVEHCTRIVEERGLEIIGIYRVPGNTGAVTSLTEAVNRGLEAALQDQEQRWTDVNVISSLLKLFFRNLPDCLLTNDLYPMFIEADKIAGQQRRILQIRHLVKQLPPHHFETLKHLMRHLSLVVHHSSINKMEARNLAIVFGPTLVRAGDDNMVTMVTDMSHQCRVVESLIQHADWCFSEDGPESLLLDDNFSLENQTSSESEANQQSLLLGNVHKLGGMKGEVSRRDIVSSIITAANRKINKSKTRKSLPSSTLSTDDTSPNEKGDKKEGSRGRRKESDPGEMKSIASAIASGVQHSVLCPSGGPIHQQSCDKELGVKTDETDISKIPTKQTYVTPTSDGTILTYTGLSETTQERIRNFEMETKACLEHRNKEWVRSPPQSTPPSAIGKLAVTEGAGLAKWKQITSPQSMDKTISTEEGSMDSLTEPNNNNNNNNNNDESDTDLVSTLTDTFDQKMKSLGLPTTETGNELQPLPALSFQDPSLHRSFTSPNLEMKVLEGNIEVKEANKEVVKEKEKEEKDDERDKAEVEKDDEKENCASCYGEKEHCRLKRSESFKQREEKKEAPGKLLRRAESLNKKEGKVGVLKRSDSLTKTEKTDLNQQRRKQVLEGSGKGKMKRKTGGGSERSIKRRHTVGGTKDFDKTTWLDNREREAAEERPERRTSSPDLVSAVGPPALVVWGAPRL